MTVVVYSYGTQEYDGTPRDRADWSYGGVSGGDAVQEFVDTLELEGHAVIESGRRPSNHFIIGVGLGHQDDRFAETGASMAAYYENDDSERWWDDGAFAARYYGGNAQLRQPVQCDHAVTGDCPHYS